jgi:hypothetical protein
VGEVGVVGGWRKGGVRNKSGVLGKNLLQGYNRESRIVVVGWLSAW